MKSQLNFETISNVDQVAHYIAKTIIQQLENGSRVLWFLPGGSAIKVAVVAAQTLAVADCERLTITLTDERYGEVGHRDSNWQQLEEAGFKVPKAQIVPVLRGKDFLETATLWKEELSVAIKSADYIIGLFGIGTDGHTAGMLPNSPAISEKSLVSAYDANDFQRITITPSIISHFDEAVVFAFGQAKWPTLHRLKENLSLSEQPAQVLKMVKKLTIFSDYDENSN